MKLALIIALFSASAFCMTPMEKILERLSSLEQRMEGNGKQIEMNKVLIGTNRANIETLQAQLSSSDKGGDVVDIDGKLALLITGGAPNGRSILKSTELFIPSSNQSCLLADLPSGRQGHTSGGRGMMMCGGVDKTEKPVDTCVSWQGGRWLTERRLARKAIYQTAWNVNNSLMLLGGPSYDSSRFRTEVVTGEGESFTLKHEASNACAIPDDENDQVYITGGGAQDIVSLYGRSGWVEDIVSMNIGRSEHGCAGYYSDHHLVLLVAGGHSESCRDTEYCNSFGWLTSTEVFRVGDKVWRQVAPLQHSLQKPVAVTLDNNIFLTGGRGSGNMKEILLFRDEEWQPFGEMNDPRFYHDVSVIELDDQINCS